LPSAGFSSPGSDMYASGEGARGIIPMTMTFADGPLRLGQHRGSVMRLNWWLVSILIIGVIVLGIMMLVPSLNGPKGNARFLITRSLVSRNGLIAVALDQFERDMGRYPDELARLVDVPQDDEVRDTMWHGPYIRHPEDLKDAWGQPFHYRHPGQWHPDGYDLWSNGPDGESGTEDDITN